MPLRVLLLLIYALFAFPVQAAEIASSPVKNEIATATLYAAGPVAPGGSTWLALHLSLPADWHTYWINPGDTGMPVSVMADLPEGATLGPIHWPTPERFEVAKLVNYGYHDDVLLLMPLSLAESVTAGSVPVHVSANWLVCKDICIPESADFTLELPVQPGTDEALPPRFEEAVQALPEVLKESARYHFDKERLWMELPLSGKVREIFFITEALASTARPSLSSGGEHVIAHFEPGPNPTTDGAKGVLILEDGKTLQFSAVHDPALAAGSVSDSVSASKLFSANTDTDTTTVTDSPLTLPLTMLLAFFGGLVLNLMPCVLPVLSLKLLGLVKKAGVSRRAAATQGIAYTAGILASFLAVAGALIALQHGGTALGWGYQLQSPMFVLGLAAVMFAVGLNLSGVFTVPGVLGNLGQKTAAQETPLGSFLTGVLATLVATPCTAPFMASAIGFALTLPPVAALAVFAALGFGLAMPYLLVSLFPALRSWLPKPGHWMETFKQFLAFPMYATAAWLLWVLATQAGPDALAIGFALLLLIGLLAWWSQHATTRPRKLALLAALFLLGGAILGQVRGMEAPVLASHAHEAFSEARLAELRAAGTPVFVNATANWCITCKVNERVALSNETVKSHFAKTGIVMLVADWTNRDAAIGHYLATFGRSGVPTYVYYPAQGAPVLLPQLLTPALVLEQTSR